MLAQMFSLTSKKSANVRMSTGLKGVLIMLNISTQCFSLNTSPRTNFKAGASSYAKFTSVIIY